MIYFYIRDLHMLYDSYYVLVHWAENDGDRWAQYWTVPFTALQPWTSIFGDTFASERTPKTVMLDLVLEYHSGNVKNVYSCTRVTSNFEYSVTLVGPTRRRKIMIRVQHPAVLRIYLLLEYCTPNANYCQKNTVRLLMQLKMLTDVSERTIRTQ